MVEVLLTDIDGTLVDSNALHAEAWRRAFERFGVQIGMDDAWRQIGKGADQLIPTFLPESLRERLETPLKNYRKEIFHRDYMPRIVPFARAHDLLARVREMGIKIALATSSDPEDLPTYGRILGMGNRETVKAGAGHIRRSTGEDWHASGAGGCAGGHAL
jgi:beta-phosphoglucomutase-like phosphatase (HAD superfamily)